MKDLKVIFMGTPDFAVPVLEALVETTNVLLVVTQPDKIVGRNKEVSFSPVKRVALDHNIDVFQPEKIRNDYEIISEINPDIIITCAYGQILPKEILDIPKLGCINVHGSLLPKYRGATPMQAAILNGDDKTGITIMYMDEKMDTGDIISQDSISIGEDDNIGTIHDKLSVLGKDLLIKTLPSIIEGTNQSLKQDEEKATYTKLIKREDELLDFNNDGKTIINKIRAYSPWPLAYVSLQSGDIKIIKAHYISDKNSEIGKVKYTKDEMLIGCNDGYVSLDIIKPIGKKQMDIKSYLNGIKKEDDYVV